MQVTICQLPNDPDALEAGWSELVSHTKTSNSAIVLLPEMSFGVWLAAREVPVAADWDQSVATHNTWLSRLDELGAAAVIGSRPVVDNGTRYNRAYVFENNVVRDVHTKFYLPCDEQYWEAKWYEPGSGSFETFDVADTKAGVQICTDMWFMHRARAYGKAGADIIFVPRATPRWTVERWIRGGQTLAFIGGCFVFSSNLCAPHAPEADLGGVGFAAHPEGDLLAVTSDDDPFVTIEVDLTEAKTAKGTYPRYVIGEDS